MSTIIANPDATSSQPSVDNGDQLIAEHLEAVRRAIWRSLLLGAFLRLIAGTIVFCLAFAVVDQWVWSFSPALRTVLGISALSAAIVWIHKRIVPLIRQRISREYAAFSIEVDSPELQHSLTSYVTLRDDRDAPGIRGVVIRSIGSRAARFLKSTGMTMPRESGGSFRWGLIVVALAAVFALYAAASPKDTLQSVRRLASPLAEIKAPTRTQIEEVTPGDSEALFGRPLTIRAKIRGLSDNDLAVVRLSANRGTNEFPMFQSEGYGAYETIIPGDWVAEDFTYDVAAGDSQSGPYQVSIRDLPAVVVSQVNYVPPAYTQLPRRSSNSGAIEGPEGTVVTLTANANRKIAKGRIEFNPRTVRGQTSATAGFAPLETSEDGRTVTATWNLQSTVRGGTQADIDSYRIHVWDETGVENVDPVIYPIRVISDLPPEIRIAVPERSPKDIPLGTQQTIEVRSLDPDYGLTTVELQIRRGTSIVKTIPLLNDEVGRRGNHVAAYRFRPDALGLRSGDLVTVEAIARDNRYDVVAQKIAPNRTVSEPVELKIIPAPPVPTDPDGDGLQAKDDQPATINQNGDGGQGDQGQAAGGGGEGGEANKGQGTGGQGEGAGQSSQGNQEPQNDGGGEGSSGESSGNGNNSKSNPKEGATANSQNPSGEQNPGDSQQSPKTGQGTETTQSGNADSPSTEDSGAESASPSDASASSNQGSNADPQKPEPTGASEPSPTNQNGGSGADQTSSSPMDSQSSSGAESPRDPPESGSEAPSPSRNDSRDTQGQSQSRPESSPPPPASSDGEAFERIRDYLNQQSQGKPSPSSSSNSQDNKNQPSSDGEGESSDGPKSSDASANENQSGSQRNGEGASSDSPVRNGGIQEPNGNDLPLDDSKPGDSSQGSESGASSDDTNSSEGTDGSRNDGKGTAEEPSDQSSGQENASEGQEKKEDEDGTDRGSEGSPDSSDTKNGDTKNGDSAGGDNSGKDTGETRSSQEDQMGEKGDSDQNSQNGKSGQNGGKNGQAPDQSSSQPNRTEEESGEDSADAGSGGSPSSADSSSASPGKESQNSAAPSPNGDPTGGNSGSNFGEGQQGNDVAPPADKIDVEAAKKATDLVLEALRHQRDNPDQKLLDELGWTPEQLRRFIDRWQSVKKLGEQTDAKSQQQFDEALQSLGLRPSGTPTERRELKSQKDRLEEIRDTGTRMQPPPQFRDAIEAFRRGVNK